MNLEPPDIETCKSIINSADVRAQRSINGSLVMLAIAAFMIMVAFSTGYSRWIDGMPYLNPRGMFALFCAMFAIRSAYLRIFGTKDGRALVWLATDYLSRHIMEAAKQHTEQHAEQVVDGKPPEAPQPPR